VEVAGVDCTLCGVNQNYCAAVRCGMEECCLCSSQSFSFTTGWTLQYVPM